MLSFISPHLLLLLNAVWDHVGLMSIDCFNFELESHDLVSLSIQQVLAESLSLQILYGSNFGLCFGFLKISFWLFLQAVVAGAEI